MLIERWLVRLFFVGVLAFTLRMTWLAAYAQGRESVFSIQAEENCYSYDGICTDHTTTKPKGEHHVQKLPKK